MRIGMIAQSMSRAAGGVGEAMLLYGRSLRSRYPEADVRIFAVEDSWSQTDRPTFGETPVTVRKGYGPARFRYSPGLAKSLRMSCLDVLHVHGLWSPHCLTALQWQRATGAALVVSPHGMLEPWILERSRGAKRAVSMLFQDQLMRRAACLHALTGTEARQIRGLYPDSPSVAVIPNCVSDNPGEVEGRPDWLTPNLVGRSIYLFFGRIHVKKGIEELIAGWEAACSRDAEFREGAALVFCGWIDEAPGFLEAVARAAARHGNVHFAGSQYGDGKLRSIAAAYFQILPSRSEGLPMTILESWRAGVPTIMTAACNLPEGFECGAAIGCLPTAGSIADALESAFRMSNMDYSRRSRAAKSLIAERFSTRSVAQKLMDMYVAASRQYGGGRHSALGTINAA